MSIIARITVMGWVLCALVVAALPQSVAAQIYPDRPVRILVGGAAGSVPDVVIRSLAERLSISIGQPIVIENRPGAAGIVAMESLKRAAPDGNTLALATMSQAVFNGYLFSKLPYDPQRDLEPVATLVTGAMVLAANPASSINSFGDMLKLSQTGGAKLFVAMPQTGSPPHVIALLMQRASGVNLSMVAYKAGAEAVAAAVAGDVPLVIEAPTAVVPLVRAGKLRALVVTGREREPGLPETPTAMESGVGNLHGEAWIGLVAPVGTPAVRIARLSAAVAEILATAEVKDLMASLGFRTLINSPDDFRRLMEADRAKWSVVIRNANLKLD